MSRLIEFAQAVEDEITDLKMQIESVNCHASSIEEDLQKEKAKKQSRCQLTTGTSKQN